MTADVSPVIRIDHPDTPEVKELLDLHMRGMLENSPSDMCHFFDHSRLAANDVTLWSVWVGEKLATIGALQEFEPGHGELKSMRTHPDFLGTGTGKHLLNHILQYAEEQGMERISLETGTGDSFAAATHIYVKAGFMPCPPFGDYEETDFNRYFTLELPQSPGTN